MALSADSAQPIWRSLPPTESGIYWFCGRRFPTDNRRLRIVEVHRCSKGCGYMSQGMSCDAQTMQGVWTPIVAPAMPSVLED